MNVNIALTAPGLAELCDFRGEVPAHDLARHFRGFSDPFLEGIDGREHRLRILGNIGGSAPEYWIWGGTKPDTRPVHLLLMVFARGDAAALDAAVAAVMPSRAAMAPVGSLPPTLPLAEAAGREHFGFADGVSQPILAGSDDAARFPESAHITALGEVVLGYANAFGVAQKPPGLGARDGFGANGSYLVFCQFEQRVRAFWDFLKRATATGGVHDLHAAEQLASKIVGRLPDGTPLVPYANLGDNEFDYGDDPYGHGCPMGAHIRRSNPRETPDPSATNLHRILRRGRSYGPRAQDPRNAGDEDRGLFFMCLNADLERQFEFIMQNWTNNPAFGGLSGERDPLIGAQSCPMAKARFTVQGLPAPVRVESLPRFITVKGAQYFFLPGMRALDALAKGSCRANV
jgi:Dyp-type peroxidase family